MTAAFALLIDLALKGSLLALIGLAGSRLVASHGPALRHDVLATVLTCCALLPMAVLAWWLLGLHASVSPVHDLVLAITPHLPRDAPSGLIELVDQIWSGDGGSALFGEAAVLLLMLWLGGLALQLARSLASYWEAARLVRRAVRFETASDSAGIDIRITGELAAPAMFGWRRPVILLPADAGQWPAARLDAVLAHEGAHIRRGDGVVEAIVQLALAVHWFNPLVRRAACRLRAARELACDERVLAGGLDAGAYAMALVHAARATLARPRRALLEMARGRELERRVRTLLFEPRHRRRGIGLNRNVAGSFALALLCLAAATAPASGLLAAGAVQPLDGTLGGLDDPMSERVPLDYEALAASAAAVPAAGPEADAIAKLKTQLGRTPRGYGDLVRERAIWTLGEVRGGRLLEPLAERMGDPDWRVRAYAAWALSATGSTRATPLLLTMLDDPVWRVRAMAAAGLAEIGDPAAAARLLQAIHDPAWQVRVSLVHYVETLRDPRVAARIRPLLGDLHNGTRLEAEAVLSRF